MTSTILALALAALVVLGCSSAEDAAQPLGTVPQSRIDRLAKGANICRWFRFPVAETEEHFKNYVTEDEAALLRSIGLTHVRLCVAPKHLFDAKSAKIDPKMLAHVDAAIAKFHKAGLAVVLDIHNEDRAGLENDKDWQEGFVKVWTQLAAHYRNVNPELLILEIVNEPVFDGKEDQWFALQERLVAAIRQEAPNHTIMASGPNWGGIYGLAKLKPVADRNVVYSFHCYDPFAFTHQGATWSSDNVKPLRNVPYPSSPEAVAPLIAALKEEDAKALLRQYGEERWDRKRMEQNFAKAIDWGKKYGVPVYCGEFGVFPPYAKPEHRAAWFRDFGGVLSENKVGWAVWGWDEGFGLARQKKDGKIQYDGVVAEALGLKRA